MPENCALCDLLTNGALKATKVYQDIFTWLVRWLDHWFLWLTRVARDKPYIKLIPPAILCHMFSSVTKRKFANKPTRGSFLLRENILFGDSLFLFDTEKDGDQSKTDLVFCEYLKIVIFRKAGCTYTKPSWGAAEFKKIWHKRTL